MIDTRAPQQAVGRAQPAASSNKSTGPARAWLKQEGSNYGQKGDDRVPSHCNMNTLYDEKTQDTCHGQDTI